MDLLHGRSQKKSRLSRSGGNRVLVTMSREKSRAEQKTDFVHPDANHKVQYLSNFYLIALRTQRPEHNQ